MLTTGHPVFNQHNFIRGRRVVRRRLRPARRPLNEAERALAQELRASPTITRYDPDQSLAHGDIIDAWRASTARAALTARRARATRTARASQPARTSTAAGTTTTRSAANVIDLTTIDLTRTPTVIDLTQGPTVEETTCYRTIADPAAADSPRHPDNWSLDDDWENSIQDLPKTPDHDNVISREDTERIQAGYYGDSNEFTDEYYVCAGELTASGDRNIAASYNHGQHPEENN